MISVMNARPSPDVELRWTTTEPTALVPMNSVGHLISKENGECAPFTIARKADFTPEKIALFLLDPHPKMPNFPLSRSEAADIAAYIGSLRK